MKITTIFATILFVFSMGFTCFGQLKMRKDKKGSLEFFAHETGLLTHKTKAMQCAVDAMGSTGFNIDSKQVSSALIGTATQAVSIEGDKDLGTITFEFVFGFRSGFVIFGFNHFKYKTENTTFKSLGKLPYVYEGKVKKTFTEAQYELLKTRINNQVSAIMDAIIQNCSKQN